MTDILLGHRLLWGVGVSVALSFLLAFLASRPYAALAQEKEKQLKVEPLLSAANTAITVSGIATPLLAALAAYAYLQLLQSADALSFLISALVVLILSVVVGLWAVFSLAAVGGAQGIVMVHKDANTFLPSYLVFQLALLMCSLVLIGLYSIYGLQRSAASQAVPPVAAGTISNVRRVIAAGEAAGEVERVWGKADSASVGVISVWKYHSPQATFELQIEKDRVVQVTERLINP